MRSIVRFGAAAILAACGPAAESSPPAATTPAAAPDGGAEGPRLSLPIACDIGRTCEIQNYLDRDPGPAAQDYRCAQRTYEGHDGIDVRLPDMAAQRRGVSVLAAAPGRVIRLRDGVPDISVKAVGAPALAGQACGNGVVIDHGDRWETQYCHLALGSVQVKVGDAVLAGQPIGRVGLSGNTEYPHLHVSVRHAGKAVDPFAPSPSSTCNPSAGLWTAEAGAALVYRSGVVLNAGFADGAVTMAMVEEGSTPAADSATRMLVSYTRAIGLQAGDVQEMVLLGPGDAVLATSSLPLLDRAKAQTLMFIGKTRPQGGWPGGLYRAVFSVRRNGAVAIERRFETRF